MFSSVISDEIHENIFWPDLPYVTDEHGSKMHFACFLLLYLTELVIFLSFSFLLSQIYTFK